MSFINLLTNQITIGRLSSTSGNKTAFTTVTTSINVNIQMSGDSKTQGFGGSVVKEYIIYAEYDADIQDGDRLKCLCDGSIYQVIAGGVTKRSMGNIEYLEVRVQKVND